MQVTVCEPNPNVVPVGSTGLPFWSAQTNVTVPQAAIQTVEDKPSVFVRTPDGFVIRHLELGASENGYVEVRQGLDAGAQVATVGSFILKSELGKGSAEHAH